MKPDRRTAPQDDSSLVQAPPHRDLTGTRLGDFEVERLLGRGGMGEVYLGRQISLNREVAIKVLRRDLVSNTTYLRRFEVEAWSAAKLNHPNIVQIYLLGDVEGLRFIVMEYVRGTNLREYLARKGAAEVPLALSIMRQAGQAVGAAGEVGLVHRDIKPENLLITKKGMVKVADFGLCRDLDEEHDVTQPGVTIGTPLYMSPEQARGKAMDHRSDLYSLGVTFYHLLAGEPPFRAETALALAMKHVSDRPVDLAVHRPDLPPDLVRLVMKLMQKAPEDRYQSAGEMLRDLARVREGLGASPTITAPAAVDLAAPATPAAGSRPELKLFGIFGRSGAKGVAVPAASSPAAEAPRPPWPDRRLLAGGLAASLAAGLAVGWLSRPGDLLSEGAPVRHGRPAAWIAPGWPEVPRKAGAAAQYRHAQLLPAGPDRDAAWVAVAGRFTAERDRGWSSQAYIQLARDLFRRGDSDRLEAFAQGLRATRQGPEELLADMIAAGLAALDGDPEKVLRFFDNNNFGVVAHLDDAALADLGLEIALRLRDDRRWKQGPNGPAIRAKLAEVQSRLLDKLIRIKARAGAG